MEIICDLSVAATYKSAAQIARVVSEAWVASNGYCLACDTDSLKQSRANTKCTDFVCHYCGHRYELKTFRKRPSKSLVDGAYATLMARISDGSAPTLFLLQRSDTWQIKTLTAIHSTFLTPSVVERRNPLRASALRAGWIGCNIRLDRIGPDGQVDLITDGKIVPKEQVRRVFSKFAPLAEITPKERGWTTLTLSIVRNLGKRQFSLQDLYAQENLFSECYPGNRHIRDKIRQQLQVLRDMQIIRFEQRGIYSIPP